MLGEELLDLLEQAARWQQLSVLIRDQRALDALAATLADTDRKIARLAAEIFQEH